MAYPFTQGWMTFPYKRTKLWGSWPPPTPSIPKQPVRSICSCRGPCACSSRKASGIPGMRLPAVPELASRFQVHRLTVLKALAGLKRTGWVQTVTGRGSFVADHLPEAPALRDPENFPFQGSSLQGARGRAGALAGRDPGRAQNRSLVSFSANFPPADLLPERSPAPAPRADHEGPGRRSLGLRRPGGPPRLPGSHRPLAGQRGRGHPGRLGRPRRARRPGRAGPGAGIPHRPRRPGAGGEPLLRGRPGPHPDPGPGGGAGAGGPQRHEHRTAGLPAAEGRRQAAVHGADLPQPHRADLRAAPAGSGSSPSPRPTGCRWWRTTPTATCASSAPGSPPAAACPAPTT